MIKLRFPNIHGSQQQQIDQIKAYLFSLVQDLNFALEQLERTQEEEERNSGNV